MAETEEEYPEPIGGNTGPIVAGSPAQAMEELSELRGWLIDRGFLSDEMPRIGRLGAKLAVLWTSTIFRAYYTGTALVTIGVGYGALILPGGFTQSLLVELASGLFFFLAGTAILRSTNRLTLPVILAVAATCLLFSYRSEEVAQSLWLEAGVGLLLIVALEFVWTRIGRLLDADRRAAVERLESL